MLVCWFCFFKQKTAYEMRISDWSSDVCSSDLLPADAAEREGARRLAVRRSRHLAMGDFQIGQLGETGTADDAQHVICPLKRKWLADCAIARKQDRTSVV